MKRFLRRAFVALVVITALGATGLMCQRVSARGRYVTAFSTYGAGPEGTRGLYLLTERMGARPRRWAEELGRLPEGAMLVALGDCRDLMRRDLGRLEREYLRGWIERGGVLVVAGVVDYATEDQLGVSLRGDDDLCTPSEGLMGMLARADRQSREEEEEDEDQTELEDLPDAVADDPVATYEEITERENIEEARLALGTEAPLDGMLPVLLRRPLDITLKENVRSTTLLRLDGPHGRPVGVRVDIGRGAVIALASASLFANRDLREHGGGVLFARLLREHAGRGPVLFDEYHLGVGQRRSMMRYLRQVGAGAIVVQVLLLAFFVIWRTGVRFGGTKIDPPPEPAGTASYVDGVATLYSKAKDPAGAARIVIRRALGRIDAHHHLGTADPERMIKLLEERRHRDAAEAVRTLSARLDGNLEFASLSRLVAEVDALVAKANADADRR